MTETLCESAACRRRMDLGQPRPRTLPGVRLCVTCRDGLRNDLLDLPALYAACETALTSRRSPQLEKLSGRRLGGISLDESTVCVRADILSRLASWAALVMDEYGVAGPQGRQVPVLVEFLDQHLDRLAAHPAAPDLAAQVADLAVRARCVLDPDRTVRLELGPCVVSGCGAMVHAAIGADRRSPAQLVTCEAGHGWPPQQWLLLCRRMEQARGGLLRGVAQPVGQPA